MTEKRIKKLKTMLQESRMRLLDSNPTFSILLMYLRFVAVSNIKKMSTDGVTVFFNPSFIEKLTEAELDYILCHQIMHVVFEHLELSGNFVDETEDFHFACDIFINDNLARAGFPLARYTHLGELRREIPWNKEFQVKDKSEVEIYEALPWRLNFFDERTRNRLLADEHDFWHTKYALNEKDVVIIDFPKIESDTELAWTERQENDGAAQDGGSQVDALLKGCVQSALKVTQAAYGIGTEEGRILRSITQRKKATLDWRKLLINFLQEEINDYSFSPPDKRYDDSPFFLPDFNEKEYLVKEILFMVDTSASIGAEALTAAYAEICGVIEQFNGKICGKIGFFDACVYPAVDFQTVKDILSIAPIGGGGTSFGIIFDYIQNEYKTEKPNCVVIFTDGEAEYPDESEALGIPVFWIINNEESNPPWGRIARIEGKEEGGG